MSIARPTLAIQQRCFVISSLCFFTAVSCTDSIPVEPVIRKHGILPVSATKIRPPEAHFAQLAAQIPGFGGYYYDQEGNLHAHLKDLARSEQLHLALRPVLTSKPFRFGPSEAQTGNVIIEKGRFDFLSLAKWRDTLVLRAGREIPGIVSFDVDEKRNQVAIGVKDLLVGSAVTDMISTLGIPTGAILIEVEKQSIDLTDSLTSLVVPPAGGLQIARQNWMGWWLCTLGFNTYYGTAFVTNSHCTNLRGPELDPTLFYQPLQSGYFLGHEINDPEYFSTYENCDCPSINNVCRRSDAALISYSSGIAPGSAGQGKIWRTASAGTGGNPGSTEIVGSITITEEESNYTVLGTQLDKIGLASGWTSGYTVGTCVDVTAGGFWYLCQNLVSALASAGDSGAPVFQYYADPVFGNPTAKLHGVLRGWNSSNQAYEFSPLSAIYAEIGYLPATQ